MTSQASSVLGAFSLAGIAGLAAVFALGQAFGRLIPKCVNGKVANIASLLSILPLLSPALALDFAPVASPATPDGHYASADFDPIPTPAFVARNWTVKAAATEDEAAWAKVPAILARIVEPRFPARECVVCNYGASRDANDADIRPLSLPSSLTWPAYDLPCATA